jgi:hypothetical protein
MLESANMSTRFMIRTNKKPTQNTMKHILLFFFLLFTNIAITNAQQFELPGTWQLLKVTVGEEIYDNLKAVYIFEDDGILKAARSAQSEIIDAGKWEYNKKKNTLIMSSSLDKDFDGTATLLKNSKNELVYEKDGAILYFKKITIEIPQPEAKPANAKNTIPRLTYTEADFFTEEGEYKYYSDEEKLPWQDIDYMLISLVNVKDLVYKYSRLDENTMLFEDKILSANVKSDPSEQTLSIDYIFYGFDRDNLPDDTDLPPNTEYSNLLYPEEENTFRVSGSEQISTPAGSFNCTVVEVAGSFETRKKLWMIDSKPGIYARIITDKPGEFGQYSVFELQEIKMKE